MTIKEIQENAREFAPIFKDKTPAQRMLYLTTEMGELALEVLKLSGFRQGGNTDEWKTNLGMEIYDVVWNLCDLANMFDLDLEDLFRKKVEWNNKRWNERKKASSGLNS